MMAEREVTGCLIGSSWMVATCLANGGSEVFGGSD